MRGCGALAVASDIFVAALLNVLVHFPHTSPFAPTVEDFLGSLVSPLLGIPAQSLLVLPLASQFTPGRCSISKRRSSLWPSEMQCVQINYSVKLSLTLLRPESSFSVRSHRQRQDQQEALGPEAPGAGGLWLAEGRAPACGLAPGYLCVPLALCSNKPTWPLTRRDYQEELCLVQRREAGLG